MPRFPLRKPSGPGRFRVATLLGVVSLGCSVVDELSSMAVSNLAVCNGIAVSKTKTSFRGAEGSAQGFRLGLRRDASQGEEFVMPCLGIAPSFRAVVSADSDFPANPPPRLGDILKRSPRANPFGIGYCSRCIAGETLSFQGICRRALKWHIFRLARGAPKDTSGISAGSWCPASS